MSDTIGRCECINQSDKYEMDKVLSEDIDELDDRLVKISRTRNELIEFGANPDELARRHESRKSLLKNLLQRVRNTPACR